MKGLLVNNESER